MPAAAMTSGIRSFTMAPYVFTTLNRSRSLLGIPQDNATFLLVKAADPTDVPELQKRLTARIPGADVLTKAQFLGRSLDHWLFATGAGVAVHAGRIVERLHVDEARRQVALHRAIRQDQDPARPAQDSR